MLPLSTQINIAPYFGASDIWSDEVGVKLKSSRHGFLEKLLINNGFKLNEMHIEVIGIIASQIITSWV